MVGAGAAEKPGQEEVEEQINETAVHIFLIVQFWLYTTGKWAMEACANRSVLLQPWPHSSARKRGWNRASEREPFMPFP